MVSWLAEMALILTTLIIWTVAWLALQIVLWRHRTFHNRLPCEQSSRHLIECDVNFDYNRIKTIPMQSPLKVDFFND